MSSSGPELVRQQTEVLTEMGSHLRDRRLEAQLTLEQISTTTRIPLRLLTAIETGDLSSLPEAVYTQGLLRRFADAVGLNGREYSEKFPTGIDPTPRFSGWRKTPAAQLRPLHLYLAYIALVIAAVTGISLSFDRMQQASTDKVEDGVEEVEAPAVPEAPASEPSEPVTSPADAVAANPSPAPSPAPSATPAATPETATTDAATTGDATNETANETASETANGDTPAEQKKDGPVSIELTVTSESWLQVLADGEVAFEGTLSEGQQAWSADREITVVAGNAGAIMVTVNGGEETSPLGEPGAVEQVTFMADSRSATPTP